MTYMGLLDQNEEETKNKNKHYGRSQFLCWTKSRTALEIFSFLKPYYFQNPLKVFITSSTISKVIKNEKVLLFAQSSNILKRG